MNDVIPRDRRYPTFSWKHSSRWLYIYNYFLIAPFNPASNSHCTINQHQCIDFILIVKLGNKQVDNYLFKYRISHKNVCTSTDTKSNKCFNPEMQIYIRISYLLFVPKMIDNWINCLCKSFHWWIYETVNINYLFEN